MHLHELLGWHGPMTHRQFNGWQDWLNRQWNEPNRSDYYQMQTTAAFKGQSISQQIIPFKLGVGDDGPPPGFFDDEDDGTEKRPEDRIQLTPASAASGGIVRVMQNDGRLREYDIKKRKYLDELNNG